MFKLSNKSLSKLEGVHPDLVRVVKRAIEITPVDFSVAEGLRTFERQKELVASGKSRTMNSRHLTGDAVDLWAYVDGGVSWDWNYYYLIAKAVRDASKELNVDLRWGGVWDMRLADISCPVEDAVNSYVNRRKALGRSAFIDGPHFEIPRG